MKMNYVYVGRNILLTNINGKNNRISNYTKQDIKDKLKDLFDENRPVLHKEIEIVHTYNNTENYIYSYQLGRSNSYIYVDISHEVKYDSDDMWNFELLNLTNNTISEIYEENTLKLRK